MHTSAAAAAAEAVAAEPTTAAFSPRWSPSQFSVPTVGAAAPVASAVPHSPRPHTLAVRPLSKPPMTDSSAPAAAAARAAATPAAPRPAPNPRRLVRKHGRFQLWASGVLLSLSLCHTLLGLATDSWIEQEEEGSGATRYRSVHGKQRLQWILVGVGLLCGLVAYAGLVTRFFGWQLAVRSHSLVSAKALILLFLCADAACLFVATESYTSLEEYALKHALDAQATLVHGSAFVLTKDSAYYIIVCIVLLFYHEIDEMRRLRTKKAERERVIAARRLAAKTTTTSGTGHTHTHVHSHLQLQHSSDARAPVQSRSSARVTFGADAVDVEMGRSSGGTSSMRSASDSAGGTPLRRDSTASQSSTGSLDDSKAPVTAAAAARKAPGSSGSNSSGGGGSSGTVRSRSSPFHVVLHHDYLSPPQRRFVFAVGMFFVMIYGGGLMFSKVEGWNIRVASDFCLTTLATVGFGNYTPQSTLGRCLLFVYFPVGFASLGFAVNLVWQVVLAKLNSRVRRLSAVLAQWIGAGFVGRKLGLAKQPPTPPEQSITDMARATAKIASPSQWRRTERGANIADNIRGNGNGGGGGAGGVEQAASGEADDAAAERSTGANYRSPATLGSTGRLSTARRAASFAHPASVGMAPPARRPLRSRSPTPTSSASSSRSHSPGHGDDDNDEHERMGLTASSLSNLRNNGTRAGAGAAAATTGARDRTLSDRPRNHNLALFVLPSDRNGFVDQIPAEERALMRQSTNEHDNESEADHDTTGTAPPGASPALLLHRLRIPSLGPSRESSGVDDTAAAAADSDPMMHDLQALHEQMATLAAMQHTSGGGSSSTQTSAPSSGLSSFVRTSSDTTDSHEIEIEHEHEHEQPPDSNCSSINTSVSGNGSSTAMLLDQRNKWRSSSGSINGNGSIVAPPAKRDEGAAFSPFATLSGPGSHLPRPPPPPPMPPAIPPPDVDAETERRTSIRVAPASNPALSTAEVIPHAKAPSHPHHPASMQSSSQSLAGAMSALQRKKSTTSVQLLLAFVFVIFWMLLSSLVFTYTERMDFFTAFYFCYVSLTTIGFGDIVPTRSVTSSFFLWFLIFGLGAVVYVLSLVGEVLTHRFEQQLLQRRKRKVARAKKRALREEIITRQTLFHPPVAMLQQAQRFSNLTAELLERARESVTQANARPDLYGPVELLRYQRSFAALVRAEEKRSRAFERAWSRAMQRAQSSDYSEGVVGAFGTGSGAGAGAAAGVGPDPSHLHFVVPPPDVQSPSEHDMDWSRLVPDPDPDTMWNAEGVQEQVPCTCELTAMGAPTAAAAAAQQSSLPPVPLHPGQPSFAGRLVDHGAVRSPLAAAGGRPGSSFTFTSGLGSMSPRASVAAAQRFHPAHSLHPYASVPATVQSSASAPVSPQSSAGRRLPQFPQVPASNAAHYSTLHAPGCLVSLAASGLLPRSPMLTLRTPMGHSLRSIPRGLDKTQADGDVLSILDPEFFSPVALPRGATASLAAAPSLGDSRSPPHRSAQAHPRSSRFPTRLSADMFSSPAPAPRRWSYRPSLLGLRRHSHGDSDDGDGDGDADGSGGGGRPRIVVHGSTGGSTVADEELGFRAGSELDSDEENVVTERRANTNEEFEDDENEHEHDSGTDSDARHHSDDGHDDEHDDENHDDGGDLHERHERAERR